MWCLLLPTPCGNTHLSFISTFLHCSAGQSSEICKEYTMLACMTRTLQVRLPAHINAWYQRQNELTMPHCIIWEVNPCQFMHGSSCCRLPGHACQSKHTVHDCSDREMRWAHLEQELQDIIVLLHVAVLHDQRQRPVLLQLQPQRLQGSNGVASPRPSSWPLLSNNFHCTPESQLLQDSERCPARHDIVI